MRPLHTSAKLEVLHGRIRERVPFRREDHRLDRDIAAVGELVRSGALAA